MSSMSDIGFIGGLNKDELKVEGTDESELECDVNAGTYYFTSLHCFDSLETHWFSHF
jgi:YHS domain-containing protein